MKETSCRRFYQLSLMYARWCGGTVARATSYPIRKWESRENQSPPHKRVVSCSILTLVGMGRGKAGEKMEFFISVESYFFDIPQEIMYRN